MNVSRSTVACGRNRSQYLELTDSVKEQPLALLAGGGMYSDRPGKKKTAIDCDIFQASTSSIIDSASAQ